MVRTEVSPRHHLKTQVHKSRPQGIHSLKKKTWKNYLSNSRHLSEAFKNRSAWDKAFLHHMEELGPTSLQDSLWCTNTKVSAEAIYVANGSYHRVKEQGRWDSSAHG